LHVGEDAVGARESGVVALMSAGPFREERMIVSRASSLTPTRGSSISMRCASCMTQIRATDAAARTRASIPPTALTTYMIISIQIV
jgi:hypothetical protein